jgi:hypothetical protein
MAILTYSRHGKQSVKFSSLGLCALVLAVVKVRKDQKRGDYTDPGPVFASGRYGCLRMEGRAARSDTLRFIGGRLVVPVRKPQATGLNVRKPGSHSRHERH